MVIYFAPQLPPSEDEIFAARLAFDHDCTLDEFRDAYLSLPQYWQAPTSHRQ